MVTYDKLKADGKNFEILFISSDRSEASFTEYYGSMPGWFALPYKDERCIQLTRLFGIQGNMFNCSLLRLDFDFVFLFLDLEGWYLKATL